MTCPKCGAANAESVQFCTNCHATLLFKCPNCEHMQAHGGTCDSCGTNFDLFWSSYMALKSHEAQQVEVDKLKAEAGTLVQILTLPLAVGASLTRFVFGQAAIHLISRVFSRLTSR
ncbi:MAG TPA: zinc ribbon domain-containing protein [Candidatus Dormibacteraeota bacterium]|nr:zinc ribbon domain-containing protein [Candidatus Dormibacteraeota bacterium]